MIIRAQLLRVSLVVTVLLSLILATGQEVRSAEALPVSQIDAYLQEQMREARIPGLAVAVVQDHQIRHTQGFGTADANGRAVTPQTPFIIGSTSKSFTAMAIMQLVEAGKLELDAPVQRYLPWFALADTDASARLTVRHLLNQTSGISTTAAFGIQVEPDGTLDSYVRQLKSVVPTAAPGALFQYSNANYSTLGLIVEVLSGQTYGDYVQQRIFAPIGMTHTFASQEEAIKDGMSSGHQYLLGFPFERSFPQTRSDLPAGFINASAEDMGRYLLAVMDGKVLSPASVAEMQRPAVAMGSDGYYAMGWMRRVNGGVPVIDHPGDVMNFKAYMAISAEQGWGVVLLANSNNPFSPDFARIAEGVVSLLAGKQPPASPGLSANLQMLLGGGLLILILLWQGWALLALKRWSGVVQRRKALWNALRIAGNLTLGIGILVGIPVGMKFPWPVLWRFTPDIGILVAAIGTLSLLLGALRLLIRIRTSARSA